MQQQGANNQPSMNDQEEAARKNNSEAALMAVLWVLGLGGLVLLLRELRKSKYEC